MIAAGRVYGHASGLVDHDDVVVFVDNADGRSSDGRLVSMCSVRDHVAVLDRSSSGGYRLAVEDDCAALYGIFLGPVMC